MDDRRKQVLLTGGIVVAFILVLGGWQLWTISKRSGKLPITVSAAPSDINLSVDNKHVSNSGTIYLAPGVYSWQATRKDFTSKKGSITIDRGKDNTFIVYLEPSDAAGWAWLNAHPQEESKIEGLAGQQFSQKTQQILSTQPLVQQLPFIGPGFEYRIDYGETPAGAKFPNQPGIYISTNSDQGKQDALAWITAQGFNPDQMNIVYQAYQQ